jgi:phage baseplate assembly protein W
MAIESARELDLDPRKTIGLELPMKSNNTSDFALTKNSLQQSQHNLKNLLLTHIGERVGQPEFGSALKALCFEQDDNELPEKIEVEIKRAVSEWLPYINIISTTTLTDEGNANKIYVKINYSTTLNSESLQSITLDAT